MSICQIYDLCAETLWLGRYGENGARDIAIDVGGWFADLGTEGTVVLVNWRPGEDDQPYNPNITMDGSKVVWSPSSIDLAISGRGFAELRYYVGNALAKSKTFRTVIDRTPSEGANPPSAAEDWLERMEDAAVTAQTASETAVTAAETATESAQAVAEALPTVTQAAQTATSAATTATNAATEAALSEEVASAAANAAQTASESATAASQTAVGAASTATAKAAQAVEAAGTATTKASEATQAATTATANAQTSTVKAGEATTAAATATAKATEATTAASTASAAATTASSAASTATSEASTATAAKTAAQTAQTGAETAQAAAESAAASVTASAEQIETNKNDITELKADLHDNVAGLYYSVQGFSTGFHQGWYGASSGVYDSEHNNAICTIWYLNKSIRKVSCTSSFKFRIQAWNSSDAYQGVWNGTTFVKSNPNYFMIEADLVALYKSYANYKFAVCLFASDGTSAVSLSDAQYMAFEFSKFETDAISESLKGVQDFTHLFTWEVGSIYADGGANYDSITAAIRTPNYKEQYLPAGTVVYTTNNLIKTVYGFKYDALHMYDERVGTRGVARLQIEDSGYYRLLLMAERDTTIDSQNIEIYSAGFAAKGKDVASNTVIYNYYANGEKIDLSAQGFNVNGVGYSLPSPQTYGASSRQDFDIYNGVLFQLMSNDYVALVDISDGTVIGNYAISCGHGNTCQFAKEKDDSADDYPPLYCFDYDTNKVYKNKVTNSSATLMATYVLDGVSGYRFSGGYDSDNNLLVSINFAQNSSTDDTDNYMTIAVWDLNDLTNNGDDTYSPALVKSREIPFIPVIQGCKVFKNRLYVVSGYYPTSGYPVKLYAFNYDGVCTTMIEDFPDAIRTNEGEGIAFYKVGNKYECYFATYDLYKLDFE